MFRHDLAFYMLFRATALCFLISILWKKSISGEAIKIEESVPKTTPMVITSEKLKMVEPPRVTSASSATSVVSEVSEVRLKVMLIA